MFHNVHIPSLQTSYDNVVRDGCKFMAHFKPHSRS